MSLLYNIIFKGDNTDVKRKAKDTESALGSISKVAASVGGTLAGAYATYASFDQVIDVTKRFQSLEAQLKTSTGSIVNAGKAFAALKEFSKDTGQDVESVVTSFNRLVNLGLDPSKEALLAYGNIAAASGKSTIDFVEAVADATTGEFERLKEFGIKSSNQGDKIVFTFRGMQTSVKNDAESIEKYLQSLGKVEFAGALENQAATLEGKLNRLGLTWDEFVYAISNSGVSDVITQGVGYVTIALQELTDLISSGQLGAELSAWVGQFNEVFTTLKNGFDGAITFINGALDLNDKKVGEWQKKVLDGLRQFPSNVTAMAKILTVELASWVDIGSAYGTAFAQAIGVELAKLADKVKIWSKEVADDLAFWDGDTFDAEAAYKRADEIANGMTQAYFKAAEDQIAAAKAARMASIEEALKTRDKTIAAYNQQSAAAKQLRAEYEKTKKAQAATDIGEYRVKKDPNKQGTGTNTAKVTDAQVSRLQTALSTEREQLLAHYNELNQINQAAYEQGKIKEAQYLDYKRRINEQYHQQIAQFEAQQTVMQLGNYEQLFGGMADIAKTFGGEQSKTYKALFAASKAFSIAQAIVSIQTGISKAIALGFPQNIPVIAATAATGAQVLSTIKGTSLKGQAHDGIGYVPAANEGTWLLKKGEMVLNNKQRDNFESLLDQRGNSAGSGGVTVNNTISIDARGASQGTEQQISAAMDAATARMKQELAKDFANGGQLYRQLKNRGIAA
ncbi:hypothetical protein JYB87_11820 [Shewanella avicenniae]|uniref:Tape measure protein N-terminal domain-containing protein n=1 Tax=Shewanella avicenniae TaxID=2814294 RepID=A0ABX7QM43_9GAMM|nr:tape measure protein [Shewanella avicenniae]QSX32454.1 hypothetical protein JYB87_11820 [Shewanella avicenniae]